MTRQNGSVASKKPAVGFPITRRRSGCCRCGTEDWPSIDIFFFCAFDYFLVIMLEANSLLPADVLYS
jgi:hypothetical protein